jgi:hypothetical protein
LLENLFTDENSKSLVRSPQTPHMDNVHQPDGTWLRLPGGRASDGRVRGGRPHPLPSIAGERPQANGPEPAQLPNRDHGIAGKEAVDVAEKRSH